MYGKDDVVDYLGKKYIAVKNNSDSPPLNKNKSWEIYTGDYNNFFYSESSPPDPTVGDRWVDTTTGRMYTYVEDSNGNHWVEF